MRKFIGGVLLGVALTLLIVLPEHKAKTAEIIESHTAELHECHMAYQQTLRKCYEER